MSETNEAIRQERARCLAIVRKAQDDVSERSATASALGEVWGAIKDGDDPRYYVPTEEEVRGAREEARELRAALEEIVSSAEFMAAMRGGMFGSMSANALLDKARSALRRASPEKETP